MDGSTPGGGLPIVVGVDGSPQSILALRWARRLSGPLHATIRAVTAWNIEVAYGPYIASDGRSDAQEVLAQALLDAFGDDPPDGLVAECRRGQPAKVLLEEARDAQMLILGSRGHGGFAGMLLGSVSSACAAHAECPVLVVHASAEPGAAPGPETQGAEGQGADEPAGNS